MSYIGMTVPQVGFFRPDCGGVIHKLHDNVTAFLDSTLRQTRERSHSLQCSLVSRRSRRGASYRGWMSLGIMVTSNIVQEFVRL